MTMEEKEVQHYLENFSLNGLQNNNKGIVTLDKFVDNSEESNDSTVIEEFKIGNIIIPKYINEFWTSKQRQASSIHEISYRACFKPQVPRFYIDLLTKKGDIVYDPFSGRGTTVIEAGLMGRNIIQNDINPLSKILCFSRFFIPKIEDIKKRCDEIPIDYSKKANIDLSMFYHQKTEAEIVSLKGYLNERHNKGEEDTIDKWIRMVATNRLTGHSKGFFSVYTLPPNQAVSQKRQKKINEKKKQTPEYKEIFSRIIKKTKSLTRDIVETQKENLFVSGKNGLFLETDARFTNKIGDNTVQLVITSPPFLNVVQYAKDNWLRCWFNSINTEEISKKITITSSIDVWCDIMKDVFKEFYRIIKPRGWVAFEVGEVKNGKIKLDEYIVPIGSEVGFSPKGIVINLQEFTKTSNIWGIKNNKKGTNTNRIVLFQKQ